MNLWVCVKSSSYRDTDNDFYGMLEEIIELDYPLNDDLHVILFKCRWVDPTRGMKVHPRYHLVDVNFKRVYQKDEPFILAQQAVQVYYTEYPSMRRDKVDWMAVCKTKARRLVDESHWTNVAYQEEQEVPVPEVNTKIKPMTYTIRMVCNFLSICLQLCNTELEHLELMKMMETRMTKIALMTMK
ncbi:UNVERIFIED_CONTAM: hypothetical protein Sradi_4062400 [Sesamum radiatum]|uniref:DUF4216 domain-containing protein n=1 Tax=Sesamum radiatum TaxID=300843 RepID=A0AAW2PLT7_SESRA